MAIAAPAPYLQFFGPDGKVLNSGTVTTYKAGTSELATVYQDAALTTAHANPLTLNSSGYQTIWLEENHAYRFVVKDSDGRVVLEEDYVHNLQVPDNQRIIVGDNVNTQSFSITSTDGKNIKFKIGGTGTAALSVTGTTTYESNVSADDDIPNKKYVDDNISTSALESPNSLKEYFQVPISIWGGENALAIKDDGNGLVSSVASVTDTTSNKVYTINLNTSFASNYTATIFGAIVTPVSRNGYETTVGITNLTMSSGDPASFRIDAVPATNGEWFDSLDILVFGGLQ